MSNWIHGRREQKWRRRRRGEAYRASPRPPPALVWSGLDGWWRLFVILASWIFYWQGIWRLDTNTRLSRLRFRKKALCGHVWVGSSHRAEKKSNQLLVYGNDQKVNKWRIWEPQFISGNNSSGGTFSTWLVQVLVGREVPRFVCLNVGVMAAPGRD